MQVQEIFVMLAFAIALIYIGRIIYRNFRSDKGCASGCGKCGVDFSDVKTSKK